MCYVFVDDIVTSIQTELHNFTVSATNKCI